MTARTHMAGGLLAGILLSRQAGLDAKETAIVTGAAVFGSLLPDIDTTKSKMGRALLPISVFVSALVRHRGPTHSLLFWPALGGIAALIFPMYRLQILAGVAGCLSHIALDLATVEGTQILFPLSRRFSLSRIRTGSPGDLGIGALLALIAAGITGQTYYF